MNYPVFAIRDNKIGFGAPRLALNEAVAKRDFAFEINRHDSLLEFAPADYDLFMIGNYNTESGHFDSCVPQFVVNGESVVEVK